MKDLLEQYGVVMLLTVMIIIALCLLGKYVA